MSPSWAEVERVLCVRLDSMGDVLMTGPALRALRNGRTKRSLTLLTSPSGAAAADLLPWIDSVKITEPPWMKGGAPSPEETRSLVSHLRACSFDAAAIFTVYSQNPLPAALLTYLADIPLRAAYCRENPYHLLTNWLPEHEPQQLVRHEVRRQLDLVRALGCPTSDEAMSVSVPPAARNRVSRLLTTRGLRGEDWLVIHPGASAPSRCYPSEGFRDAAKLLVERLGVRLAFTGASGERQLIQTIQSGLPRGCSVSFAGELSLVELAALIAEAPMLLVNNTGPAHIASAVGTPVVSLYALTNPQHTPWQVPSEVLSYDVPCRYCYKSVCPEGHHNCLRMITPEQILEACRKLLSFDDLQLRVQTA